MAADYGIVLWGATGFTGRLVAAYLAAHPDAPSWAIAGRSERRLAEVAEELGLGGDVGRIVADADDPASLAAMVGRGRVIVSTVGPYQLYGSALVAACTAAGRDYVDLCGEPAWMRAMIDAHHEGARASGARIVHSCGFDSIPFDLGVWSVQAAARERFGAPAPRVKGRVMAMRGGASGGTVASARATMAAAARDRGVLRLMLDPFALTPGFQGPDQPNGLLPHYDAAIGAWTAPFIMAAINTKNVHRTNALLGHAWGTDFRYDEMMAVPGLGDLGRAAAEAFAKADPLGDTGAPGPGEGPSPEEQAAGHYSIAFVAEMPDGARLRTDVTGDRDPGYGSTNRMIAEAAILLGGHESAGGVWTPGALMAGPLRDRLAARAGLGFTTSGEGG